jgi:hypothetical protein
MDMLMRPSPKPQSLLMFHVGYGHPLQIPVSETYGCVIADSLGSAGDSMTGECPSSTVTAILSHKNSDRKLRIDLEPNWQYDPRKVLFSGRVDGIIKAKFSPVTIAQMLGGLRDHGWHLFPPCNCEAGVLLAPVKTHWFTAEVSELSDAVEVWNSKILFSDCGGEDTGLYIHAAGDIGSQVFAYRYSNSRRW